MALQDYDWLTGGGPQDEAFGSGGGQPSGNDFGLGGDQGGGSEVFNPPSESGPPDQPPQGGDTSGGSGSGQGPREIFPDEPVAPRRPEPSPGNGSGGGQTPDVRPRNPGGDSGGGDTGGGGGMTPGRPSSPTPVASQPPAPFTPMDPMADPSALVMPRDPGAANVALRAPQIPEPTSGSTPGRPSSPSPVVAQRAAPFVSQPQQFNDASNPTAMFGRADGALGGGLGVAGAGSGFETNPNDPLDALIRTLLGGQ